MGSKKLAICIPTYNRPLMIEELLLKNLKRYSEYGWDLYIYDSSTDDSTRIIIEDYSKKFSNIFYEYIDSSIHSNLKVYTIFENFGSIQAYEYIWVCSDGVRWSKEVFDTIYENLKMDYDLLVVSNNDVENIGTKVFTDYNDFFVACAWFMNLYGSTILKVDTMLQDVPWEYLRERYCVPERINFSHVAYYFEKICSMTQFKAKYLVFSPGNLQVSALKRRAGWENEAFSIWCTFWPSTVMALPDCYCDKERVIKQTGTNSGLLLEKSLITLREKDIYTYDIYKKYKNEWKYLTTLSSKKLKLISLIPKKWAWILQYKYFHSVKKVERRVVKFARKYSRIYIYGCGRKAVRFSEYLEKNNIDFQGYIVSSMDKSSPLFMNKKVQQFESTLLSDFDMGLILALNKDNTQEVLGMIKKTNIKPICGILFE